MTQHDRRREPYPWTWEPAALTLTALSMLLVAAIQLGRAVANTLAGAPWQLPPADRWLTSTPGILRGDATAGLSHVQPAASPSLLTASVATTAILLVAVSVFAAVVALRRWGPGRVRGVATPGEVARLLGRRRLRRVRAQIRPDLHPAARTDPTMSARFRPEQVGWRLGRAAAPRGGGELWVPWDRTAGVIGPQGSGKTLDLLVPALLGAPGAALVTLTKSQDLLLTYTRRSAQGRPCVVVDPFDLAPGLPGLVWDPVAGCADPWVAQRRARAFCAGLGDDQGAGSDAGRFYAAEAAKVVAAFLHAAGLAGHTLDRLLRWVANPAGAVEPIEILRSHPRAAGHWHSLLAASLTGDDRTTANTATTVQQALGLFFQPRLRARCTPGPGRPPTDLHDLVARAGTVYLLGRDDPYSPASPLLTAIAEDVLDTALILARTSPWGRLCPPLLACLDELPSTAPLPTLRTRMANERALGVSFLWAAQTWRQLVTVFGEPEARALLGLTNLLVVFGGSNDATFNRELSDLLGHTRVARSSTSTARGSRTVHGDDMPVLTVDEIRLLPDRQALVLADRTRPIIARLERCLTGRPGRRLLADQASLRARLGQQEPLTPPGPLDQSPDLREPLP